MRCPLLVSCVADGRLDVVGRAGADALVLDLGPATERGVREAARLRAARCLVEAAGRGVRPMLGVRVAPLASGLLDADLDAVMPAAPDVVVLPGVVGGPDVQHLAAKLAVREAECGLPHGRTGILAIAGDTARGVLALQTLPGACARLMAIGWDPGALAVEAGAPFDPEAAACRAARGFVLLAATAAGVPAIDAPTTHGSADLEGDANAARRDGFHGKFALRPEDVPVILRCLAPRGAGNADR